jgi:type IV secretion system protein VirB8
MIGKRKAVDRARGGELEPVTKASMVSYQAEHAAQDVDLIDEVVKSRTIAWNVAKGFGLFGSLAIVLAAVVVFRYAHPVPTKMLLWNGDLRQWVEASTMPPTTSYGIEEDKYWIALFVNHIEAYDFYAAQAHYDAVSLMATPQVADPYKAMFAGPKGLDKVLGDSIKTTVKVTNVMPDPAHGVATVRYTLTTKYKARPLPEPPVYKIATIA